jgi:hypothetical protein
MSIFIPSRTVLVAFSPSLLIRLPYFAVPVAKGVARRGRR